MKKLQRRRFHRGMTLIEIIVVITILSLLTAAVGVAVIPKLNEAKVSKAKLDISTIMGALKMYYAKNGKYPENGTSLQKLYDQQFIERRPVDPWDHDYVYILENGKPIVKSYGEDGAPGGTDLAADISSADLDVPPITVRVFPPKRAIGMTLIELVVAIAIVVTLFGAVGFGIGALTGAKAKTASTELAASMRALSTTATLGGKTCRLVFQLPAPDARDRATTYWGECAPGDVTALTNDAERRKTDTLSELELKEQERIERAVAFSSYTDEYISKHTLPENVHVEVWTPRRREVVKDGLAPIYFFRHGVAERALVWFRQGSNTWTLRLDRLTGQTSVIAEDLPVPST